MDFAKSYYEDEVIDGFYVPSMVKRGWAAQLEVLKVVIDICEKNNIQYFAEWGTLLGAVRHRGYIPWDDDIDISMKRDDYEKFFSIAQKELPEGYKLFNTYTDSDVEEMLSRVVNTRIMSFEPGFLDKFHGFPYIAGIDIFPLDFLPRDEEALKESDDLSRIVFALARDVENKVLSDEEFENVLSQVEDLCAVQLDRNKPMKRQLFRLGEGLYGAYTEEESDFLTNMTIWQENPSFMIPKGYYADAITMKFEGIEINVPIGYDSILKQKFGDYMKLVKGGGGHDYPFFDRQEKLLKRETGIEVYNYKFDAEELKKEEYQAPKTILDVVLEYVDVLLKANTELVNLLVQEQYEQVLDMLEQLQTLSLQLGNQIETEKVEAEKTIYCLEQYCERVYEMYCVLTGTPTSEVDIEELFECMHTILENVEISAKEELKGKKTIVFLPFKASAWKTMEYTWKSAVKEGADVYVIPIPYYDRDVIGRIGEMHYEGDSFPTDVPITSYMEFDLQVIHPDVIYINNPYDEYNFATVVPNIYFSSNLKNWTEKLIYIPWFITDEITPTDERAIKNMKYYCTVPGLVNSDVVMVSSEQMKELYVEVLTEWAGEDTRGIWKNKITVMDYLQQTQDFTIDKNTVKISDSWLPVVKTKEGLWKKTILYVTESGGILEYGDQALDKLERNLQTFYDYSNQVALLWYPKEENEQIIRSMKPECLSRYLEIVGKYKEAGWGILNDLENTEILASFCDAYYGDTNEIVQLFRNQNKPVMIQSIEV